jgi:hypothetical protein
MATVAKLNVQIGAEVSGLDKALKGASRSLESFGKSAMAIGQSMSTFITAPIVGGFGLAVKAASDAEETFSKFATVFRDVEDSAENAFQTLRKEYGLSSTASKQLLGDTGDLLTGFGFAQDEALRLSTEVQKLAVDLASFTNFSGGAEGASQALTKALLGERESVKALGISILEEDVQKQMAINTAKGLTFATERQAKAQATLDLAIQQSGNAIGDYNRTSDSFANQLRLVQARISDLAVELGQILLPVATRLLDRVKTLVTVFQNMDATTKTFLTTAAGIVAVVGPVITILGGLALAIKGVTVAILANPIGVFIATLASLGVVIGGVTAYNRAMAKSALEAAKANEVANGTAERSILLQTRIKDLSRELSLATTGDERREQVIAQIQVLSEQLRLNEEMIRSNKKVSDSTIDVNTKTAESYRNLSKLIEDNQIAIEGLTNSSTELTDKQLSELALRLKTVDALEKEIERRKNLARLQNNQQGVTAFFTQEVPVSLQQPTIDSQRYAESMGVLGSKIQQVTVDTSNLNTTASNMSPTFEILSGITEQFVNSFGAGLANVIVQGEKLQDVLKNIGKLLLSSAIQKGISLLLTGGLSSAGTGFFGSGGGLFGKLFGQRVNDALITSSGKVIEFSPKDNIMAMQDFGQLKTNSGGVASVRVSVDDIRLSGSDILIALKNAERAYG